MSFARGGERGVDAALRARTVNHLVLDDGREVTGRVTSRVPEAGPPALVRLDGPVLLSRGGVAAGRPFPGEAIVALGDVALPERGAFDVSLASGLRLRGFAVGEGEVLRLEATLGGRALDLPPWAVLVVARSIPSVAGGPADPGAWDGWFGALSSFAAGEGEARARAHKAAALPPALAALYAEVRAIREGGAAARDRLLAIREAARAFADDWLLAREVDELLDEPTTAAGPRPSPSVP
jgi:phenylalanine-4-hydroxylase